MNDEQRRGTDEILACFHHRNLEEQCDDTYCWRLDIGEYYISSRKKIRYFCPGNHPSEKIKYEI